jgi:hypothetical protein
MTEEVIPRKWEYIADQLRELNAPKKVINAATELDNIMVKLGLGFSTSYWERHYLEFSEPEDLHNLIFCQSSCTACEDCSRMCYRCKLGTKNECTPRSRYADEYFHIVGHWSKDNLR